MFHYPRRGVAIALSLLLAGSAAEVVARADVTATPAHAEALAPAPSGQAGERIAPYLPRFARTRPVIAVIGENGGTELTDYVIPYAILRQAQVADVITLATKPGPLTMRPALHVQPQATIDEFDARFPQGADYVIVPAVVNRTDTALLGWIKAQGTKGGTIVSICDGALVVAATGLMDGHRATAHWATRDLRKKTYPAVHWVDNARYVADGRIVSSAGISAAIPTSLALVEAIAGHARAAEVGQSVGLAAWDSAHDSHVFHPRFGRNLTAFAHTQYLNPWFHRSEAVGLTITPGVDELAVALIADAYSRTGRSRAYGVSASAAPLVARYGLTLIPDRVSGGPEPVSRILPPLDATPSARMLDKALAGIAHDYGRSTAFGVAMDFEYPGYHD